MQMNTTFNSSAQQHLLSCFDEWFSKLPRFLQVLPEDQDWKGRGLVWMNAMYHVNRLKILKPLFLDSLDNAIRHGFWNTDSRLQECFKSLGMMTLIARVFYTNKHRAFQNESSYLQSCIYFSALFHCAMKMVSTDHDQLQQSFLHHLNAIQISYSRKYFERLEECGKNPGMAVAILRSEACWAKHYDIQDIF
jgi:hypothetical protein